MCFREILICLILSTFVLVKTEDCNGTNFKILSMPNLKKKLKLIQLDCGEVCDTKVKATRSGKYYDFIEKNVDCHLLFESPIIDGTSIEERGEKYTPPYLCELPHYLRDQFTYNGRIKESAFYFNDFYPTGEKAEWSKELVELYQETFRKGTLHGSYGLETVKDVERHIRDHMLDLVEGGHILVIGSGNPWIEAILLELGVSNITTLEYNEIVSSHPKIKAITPIELNEMVLQGQLGPEGKQFDGVVTFSSLEHSGLGRYGDHLNPWADLITMSKAWCLTKTGGRMLIGVPTGLDEIIFNSNRIYGHLQYSHLFANWDVVYTEAIVNGERWKECGHLVCYQPIHILEKKL